MEPQSQRKLRKILQLGRRRNWLGLAILVITLVIGLAQQQGWLSNLNQAVVRNQPGLYRVTRFVDGDTIRVDMNGAEETIRMVGVDTPETHKPSTPVQCYGPAAAAYTKRVIAQQRVRLVSDSLSTDRDRYNRLLRYVYLTDGTNFNQRLISEGYGFYYPHFPFTKSDEFASAQREAQAAKKGLWLNCQPQSTKNGGYESNVQ